MKAAIYARVSDDKKKSDGDRRQDVNRQVDLIKQHILRMGIKGPKIAQIYIDDGKSAYTEDWNCRQGFKQMFNDCRRYLVDQIFIEDMTRFSRRLDMGLKWLKELSDLNVNLTSLKEGELEVTSSKGWMQSSLLLMMAEWDSRVRSEKVRSGMMRAKAQGKRIGGRNPTPPALNKSRAKK